MKTGLVLEGGGTRGIYTAGVLDVFMEKGITFDGVIGVSAGAIHGSSYVSGQIGRSVRYYKKYCKDKRFMSMRNFIFTGDFVGEKFCYHDLPEKLDLYDYDTFNKSKTEFYVTCSNLQKGLAEYIKITDMKKQIDYIRASASMPYISKTVELDGMKLLDGGCCDSIPVKAFMGMGFEKCVVVLTRDINYIKEPEKAGLAKFFYKKYPRFVKALEKRHIAYNNTLKYIREMEEQGKIFVIRPAADLQIGRMERNPDELQRVYELGRMEAVKIEKRMREWLTV